MKQPKTPKPVRSSELVRRRATICTMMRIPHDERLPMFQIWNVVSSNGRHLCECKTESAAKLIVDAINQKPSNDQAQRRPQ